MKLFHIFFCVVFVNLFSSCNEKEVPGYDSSTIHITPEPAETTWREGVFTFNEKTALITGNNKKNELANLLAKKFKAAAGFDMLISNEKQNSNYVSFEIDTTMAAEAYDLDITTERIAISAKDAPGILYGIETLRQLLPVALEKSKPQKNVSWVVPNLLIKD